MTVSFLSFFSTTPIFSAIWLANVRKEPLRQEVSA